MQEKKTHENYGLCLCDLTLIPPPLVYKKKDSQEDILESEFDNIFATCHQYFNMIINSIYVFPNIRIRKFLSINLVLYRLQSTLDESKSICSLTGKKFI